MRMVRDCRTGETRGASAPGRHLDQSSEHTDAHGQGFVCRELPVDQLSVSRAGPDWSMARRCQQRVGRGLVMTPRSPASMPSPSVTASFLEGSFIRWPWEITSLSRATPR